MILAYALACSCFLRIVDSIICQLIYSLSIFMLIYVSRKGKLNEMNQLKAGISFLIYFWKLEAYLVCLSYWIELFRKNRMNQTLLSQLFSFFVFSFCFFIFYFFVRRRLLNTFLLNCCLSDLTFGSGVTMIIFLYFFFHYIFCGLLWVKTE